MNELIIMINSGLISYILGDNLNQIRKVFSEHFFEGRISNCINVIYTKEINKAELIICGDSIIIVESALVNYGLITQWRHSIVPNCINTVILAQKFDQ